MTHGKCCSISDIFLKCQLVHLGKQAENPEAKFTRHGRADEC